MQSLAPLSESDLLEKVTQSRMKLEVYYDASWQNIAELAGIGEDILESISLSFGGATLSPEPIAATWSAQVYNKGALFFPDHPTSALTDVFTIGRKVRLYIGIRVNGTDYYWKQLTGVMNKPIFTGKLLTVNISGHDSMQVLKDTELKHLENYWGDTHEYLFVAAHYEYEMPGDCNGVYAQIYYDGEEFPNADIWIYDPSENEIVYTDEIIIIDGQEGEEITVHYYTDQAPENVVADILVIAELYVDRAAALAAMDYTATGITIPKVRFKPGTSCLQAIKMMCERCNYRFYIKNDETPFFKPEPSEKAPGSEDLVLNHTQICEPENFEEEEELKNRIVIIGDVKHVPLWRNVPVAEDSAFNNYRGISTDAASIAAIGEKTLTIENHLFQDQSSVDDMCDELLAERKDKKKYIKFDLKFGLFPLEMYDTVRIQRRLTESTGGKRFGTFKFSDGTTFGSGGIVIAQRGLLRDIKIDKFKQTLIFKGVT